MSGQGIREALLLSTMGVSMHLDVCLPARGGYCLALKQATMWPPVLCAAQVAVTRVTPIARPSLVSHFHDRPDLIKALMTSCHIPLWMDGSLFTGGLAAAAGWCNQPVAMLTSCCFFSLTAAFAAYVARRIPRRAALRRRPDQLHSAAAGHSGRSGMLLPQPATQPCLQVGPAGWLHTADAWQPSSRLMHETNAPFELPLVLVGVLFTQAVCCRRIGISPDSFEPWDYSLRQMLQWAFEPADEATVAALIEKGLCSLCWPSLLANCSVPCNSI